MGDDQEKAKAFSQRMLGALNQGALCLMTSIGHRTGLFDALAEHSPVSSEDLAKVTGLHDRYVREWLGAMVTGQVVEYDENAEQYILPQEHAACLTRKGEPNNIAALTQYIPMLGAVEDDILHCFSRGGGVPYFKYARFHEVMAEHSGQSVVPELIDHILPLVPGLVERLEKGIRMLDVGCGSGRALNVLGRQFPHSTFLGYDLSEEAVGRGMTEAREGALTNVQFVARDLSRFNQEALEQGFELITTFDAIHDQAQPLLVLKGIHRALKSDGVYIMQDFHASSHLKKNQSHPLGPFLYALSCLNCIPVSFAQGGEGLGAMWGEEKVRDYLTEAGFSRVEVHQLTHNFQNNYYIIRK